MAGSTGTEDVPDGGLVMAVSPDISFGICWQGGWNVKSCWWVGAHGQETRNSEATLRFDVKGVELYFNFVRYTTTYGILMRQGQFFILDSTLSTMGLMHYVLINTYSSLLVGRDSGTTFFL